MVIISQRDFNKSMNSYISDIRIKEGIFPKKVSAKRESVVVDHDLEEYKEVTKSPNFFTRFFSKSNIVEDIVSEDDFSEDSSNQIPEEDYVSKYEELEEVERVIEKKKDSIFARLFKRRESSGRSEDDFVEGIEVYDEKRDSDDIVALKDDIKKLGMISYDVMRKLNADELKKFKLSEDFAEYKEILKRHNLIRAKY